MNDRSDSSPRPKRFLEEVLTIVLGVLLALAADAGRKHLANRASERAILADLRTEFSADVHEIGADQEHRAKKLAALDLLESVRAGVVRMPPPDELAPAVLLTLEWRYYTPSHPVLDDLLTTGRLELLSSPDLRLALMRFGQERTRIAVTEEQERQFVARTLEPYLATRVDLQALAEPRTPEQRAGALQALPALLADEQFGSLLYFARKRTASSHDFAERLLQEVIAVQVALGA